MNPRDLQLPNRRSHADLWERPRGFKGHEPQPRNEKPMNGGPGGLAPIFGSLRRSQAGGGGGFLEKNGVYVPLQGTNAADPLNGGYGWCDWTDGGVTPHPGSDLNSGSGCNADEGAEIVAQVAGVAVACLAWDGYTSGEGNHLWVYYDDAKAIAPAWAHFDHLAGFAISEGQRFDAGQVLGWCGRTGNWDCAHAHCELMRQQPSSWWVWPYGWSRSAVEATYFDPYIWTQQTVDRAAGLPIGDGVGVLPMDTTEEERQAMKPYFDIYGIDCNMNTGLMQRACLAYKRDETPGPALTQEYPYGDYVRQDFTCRILEYHPDDGLIYYVEVVKDAQSGVR